jgi:putative ABC transport system permease protein
VNFFVIAPPSLLEDYPASFITSFYAPSEQDATLTALAKQFPNVLVIDVAQILAQVQRMMSQAAHAVQFVFAFTLAAGLVVLYAAIAGAREEREYEAAVMRVLGAHRNRILSLQLTEFALAGALAGLFAAAGANALGYVLAHRVLHLDYLSSSWDWAVGIMGGAIGVGAAGWLGVRQVLDAPPLQTLRKAV